MVDGKKVNWKKIEVDGGTFSGNVGKSKVKQKILGNVPALVSSTAALVSSTPALLSSTPALVSSKAEKEKEKNKEIEEEELAGGNEQKKEMKDKNLVLVEAKLGSGSTKIGPVSIEPARVPVSTKISPVSVEPAHVSVSSKIAPVPVSLEAAPVRVPTKAAHLEPAHLEPVYYEPGTNQSIYYLERKPAVPVETKRFSNKNLIYLNPYKQRGSNQSGLQQDVGGSNQSRFQVPPALNKTVGGNQSRLTQAVDGNHSGNYSRPLTQTVGGNHSGFPETRPLRQAASSISGFQEPPPFQEPSRFQEPPLIQPDGNDSLLCPRCFYRLCQAEQAMDQALIGKVAFQQAMDKVAKEQAMEKQSIVDEIDLIIEEMSRPDELPPPLKRARYGH